MFISGILFEKLAASLPMAHDSYFITIITVTCDKTASRYVSQFDPEALFSQVLKTGQVRPKV